MLVHTGRKVFKFELCEKKFSLKEGLKIHMLPYSKVKGHECDICKKKFTQKAHFSHTF